MGEEELNKAAAQYARDYTENDEGNGGDDWEDDIRITFIAGAKWAMGQGMIREGKIVSESGEVGWIEYDTPAQVELMEHFKNGDEIVLQIRKKNWYNYYPNSLWPILNKKK